MSRARGGRSRAVFAAALALLALAALPGVASAQSVIDTSAPAFGRSAWTYSDLHDANAKYEGGYAAFDDTSTLRYVGSPHGGYSTATDKCRVCHAVHRAESSFELTRGEWRGDACVYCHVGSAHSSMTVYDGNADGMATVVGHTIGASPEVPLSTTHYTSLGTAVVAAMTTSGTVATTSVPVRSVDATANRMYRLRLRHGQSAAGLGNAGYERIGPLSLTCLSCHVAHGESAGQWHPRAFPARAATLTAGYKLLRARPSGSIQGPDGMPYSNGTPGFTVSYTAEGQRGFKSYSDFRTTGLVDVSATVGVPESTLTAGAYGLPETTWDSAAWGGTGGVTSDPRGVDQYALSAWCADCHNLAIGSYPRPQGQVAATVVDADFAASDETEASGAADTFETVKTFSVDTAGAVAVRVVTELRSSDGGEVEARVSFGSVIASATHATTSVTYVAFVDTFTVPPSAPTTSVTLELRRVATATVAWNRAFAAYLARTHISTATSVADLSARAHEASMTHSAPFSGAYNGPAQCFTCHRTGGLAAVPSTAAYDPSRAACERCHYGTGAYAADPARLAGASDFPHSGESSAVALLGAWTFDGAGSRVETAVTSANVRATVCRRCHAEGARTHPVPPVVP